MAYDQVEVYLAGPGGGSWEKSTGWTNLRLSRGKDDLTGSLSIDYFFGYVPQEPVLVDAARGREILVYIDGWLAFTGLIDARQGKGSGDNNGGRSINIGPDQYTVSLVARGKTKSLIDSSHDIRANMNGTTSKEVVERLVQAWGIEIEWEAAAQALDKVRFRDGARIIDELSRIALENGHYIYETRSGGLRVSDGEPLPESGPDLVLGRNILSFTAEQSEASSVTKIRVKGQRTEVDVWGEDAVLPTVIDLQGPQADNEKERTIVVQHYGNASEESLYRRAQYEANKRMQKSRRVTVEVFGVSTDTSRPWDLGQRHRVLIPCEGIDLQMECTELAFSCGADGELRTSLTLAALPMTSLTAATGALSNLPLENLEDLGSGVAQMVAGYPEAWSVGSWSVMNVPIIQNLAQALNSITKKIFGTGLNALEAENGKPPERLS